MGKKRQKNGSTSWQQADQMNSKKKMSPFDYKNK